MGLARREIPGGQTGRRREQLHGSIGAIFAGDDFVIVRHNSSNQAVNGNGSTDCGARFCGLDKSLLGRTLGDVQDVAGLQANVFSLKLHDLFQVDVDFVLLAVAVVANDDSVIGFGGVIEATSKGKQLQCSELSTIIGNHEAARAGDCTERVHDTGVGHCDDVARLQHDVAGSIAVFENASQIYGNSVGNGRRNGI